MSAAAVVEPSHQAGRLRRPPRWLVLGLVAAVVLAGLAYGLLHKAQAPVVESDRRVAPAFSLPDLRDPAAPAVRLPSRGPAVVYFFASWCVPCRRELPIVQRVFVERGDEIRFVGVDHLDQPDDGREFLEKYGATFPAGSDPGGDVALKYRLRGLPATVFVDRAGRIASVLHGEIDEETLVGHIDELTLHEGDE